MKRLKKLLACAVIVLSTSGCGKQQVLECKMSADQSGVKMEQVMTFNFKGDTEITEATIDQKMVLSEDSLKVVSLDDYKEVIEKQWVKTEYSDFDYKITDNGKDTINFFVKMTAKDVEKKYGSSKNEQDIKEFKKDVEKGGYSCTIK